MSNGEQSKPANPGAFQPGKSGNPGGKPKGIIRAIREKHADNALKIVDALVEMALDAEVEPKHRIAAGKEALDRIIGRPQQKVDIGGDLNLGPRVDMRDLSEEELRALARLDIGADGDEPVH